LGKTQIEKDLEEKLRKMCCPTEKEKMEEKGVFQALQNQKSQRLSDLKTSQCVTTFFL